LCVLGIEREGGAKDGTEDIAVVIVPTGYMREHFQGDELLKEMRDEVKKLSKSLAPYKRPINVILTEKELPRTATRKIKRKQVKELILSEANS
jgi:long-chain acyl-CoA synthetase